MLVSISSLVDQFETLPFSIVLCHPFSVAEHETAKSISSIGIHFCQNFTQNRLPDIKAYRRLDEFDLQKLICSKKKMTNLDPI